MAWLYLASALFLGAGLWRGLRLRSYPFEAAALIVTLGLVGWTWLAFLVSLILPYTLSLPIAALAAAVAGAWLLYHGRTHQFGWLQLPSRRAWLAWSIATVLVTVGLARLFWTHSLLPVEGGLYSGGATWADIGVHSSLIQHFAASDHLPLDNPIASGLRLTYPFLTDLLSALYLQAGWSFHWAVFVPSLLLAGSAVQLFIALSLRLFNRLSAALTGLALFLLGGATAGFDAAWADWHESGLSLGQFLSHLPRDYTSLDQFNAHFNNVVADALLPQRSFLFGLSLFLVIAILLTAWRADHEPRHRWAAAVIIGLLPLSHAHTLIAALILTATFIITDWRHHPAAWRGWIGPLALAAALALPQLLWQQLSNGDGTGGHFSLGWMLQPGEPLLAFWWRNFGPWAVYAAATGPLLFLHRPWRRYLGWYAAALALIIIAHFYAFQPFAYDNLKLLMYAFLILALLAGWHLAHVARHQPSWLLVLAPFIIIAVIPGCLTITREFQAHDQFAAPDDVALAAWVRIATPPSAVFAGTDRVDQPATMLAGRPTLAGYRGWLYSYNIPYADRLEAVSLAYQGRAADPLVQRFHPDYLTVSIAEDPSWTIDRPALAATYPVVYRNDTWTVYRLPR